MRRPVTFKRRFLFIRGIVSLTLSLASIFVFAGLGKTQALEKATIKSDRNKPLEAPKKGNNASEVAK